MLGAELEDTGTAQSCCFLPALLHTGTFWTEKLHNKSSADVAWRGDSSSSNCRNCLLVEAQPALMGCFP